MQRWPQLWRGSDRYQPSSGVPTGISACDAALPQGGWPPGALTELLVARWGIGELQLLLPTLRRFSRQGQHIAWVAPPFIPYAPALVAAGVDLDALVVLPARGADIPWSAEKFLRAESCGLVLMWLQASTTPVVRRLQLAAEAGDSLGFLLRLVPDHRPGHTTAAALRLRLEPGTRSGQLAVQILKTRGTCRRSGWVMDL